MAKLLVINGPNLSLLGQREPHLYGSFSLKTLEQALQHRVKQHQLLFFQSDAEHEIIQRIHQASKEQIAFLIINPAALAHTSIALRDALLAVNIPFFEVHITNIYARESFRHNSYLTDIAQGSVTGLGLQGYIAALEAAIEKVS